MVLPYDPGPLPRWPSPNPGEAIEVQLAGLPPYKDLHFSIRNSGHRHFDRFLRLRQAAISAMNGRARYAGPVAVDLEIEAPKLDSGRTLQDYVGGVLDSLDGSHGFTFTYLPIVYEDDCQVASIQLRMVEAPEDGYRLRLRFLQEDSVVSTVSEFGTTSKPT